MCEALWGHLRTLQQEVMRHVKAAMLTADDMRHERDDHTRLPNSPKTLNRDLSMHQ